MAATILEARDLTRILPGTVPVTLVHDVNLKFSAGEFVAITGPSGSGKSSLLYLLGLLDRPTSGAIWMDGKDTAAMSEEELAERRLSQLGFVFQFHFLLPEFTLLDNVLIPMRRLGRLGAAEMRDKAAAILDRLDLADHMAKRPDQLSGGQRQRAAIARALANDAAIVLADEPTGNLDSRSSAAIMELLAELNESGTTILVITHNPEVADALPRQIHIRDGRVESDTRTAGDDPRTGRQPRP